MESAENNANNGKQSSEEEINNMNESDDAQNNDSIEFYDVDSSTYPKTYNFLKMQKETLVQIQAKIDANKDSLSQTDKQSIDFLEFLTESLIMCDFGSIFLSASNSIPALQNILKKSPASQFIVSIASSLLTVSSDPTDGRLFPEPSRGLSRCSAAAHPLLPPRRSVDSRGWHPADRPSSMNRTRSSDSPRF